MKIAVYGAGGIGGYFGGRLAQAGADVHLIARGDHLKRLRTDGLQIESKEGNFSVDLPATDDPTDIGPCDYVLFCVKSFDTKAAAADLHPLLSDETAVISLQNGVTNEEMLADSIGADHVMGGVAYIFSTIDSPGVISHTGGPARIVFGELEGEQSERAKRLLATCHDAQGMEAELSEDVEAVLWDKFAFICAVAGVTAASRLPMGEIRKVDESWALFQELLEEVDSIGRAVGVSMPPDTVDRWTSFATDLDPDAYSSLHYDLTNGKRMELDALHGAVVRYARETGTSASMNEAIYRLLKPWAVRNE